MKTENLVLFSIIAVCVGFLFALLTGLYGYFIFFLLGYAFYLLSKRYGKEIYFLLLLPLFIMAVSLLGRFMILDYYDRDGMNPLRLHPFTISWLVTLSCEMLEAIAKRKIFIDKVVILGVSVIAVFSGLTFITRGTSGMPLAVENYVSPISFFLFCYCYKTFDINKVRTISKITIITAIFIGIMGIIEYAFQYNILDVLYSDIPYSWVESISEESYRIRTIVGHPLMNALYFLMIMIMVHITVDNNKFKYALLLYFPAIILLTGSRSVLLVSLLVLFYKKQSVNIDPVKREKRSYYKYNEAKYHTYQNRLRYKPLAGRLRIYFKYGYVKNALIALLIITALMVIIFATPFGDTFLNRLGNSDESTQARIILVKYFLNNLDSFVIRGLGGSDTVLIYNEKNQVIIAENPWIILFLEVSYLSLLYLAFLIMVLRKIQYWFLILIFLLALSFFNSFGVKGTCNYMVFYLISLSCAMQDKKYEHVYS